MGEGNGVPFLVRPPTAVLRHEEGARDAVAPQTDRRVNTPRPRAPDPRETVIGRARAGDEDTYFWRAIYYGADYALLLGRGQQVLDALTAIVTAPEET